MSGAVSPGSGGWCQSQDVWCDWSTRRAVCCPRSVVSPRHWSRRPQLGCHSHEGWVTHRPTHQIIRFCWLLRGGHETGNPGTLGFLYTWKTQGINRKFCAMSGKNFNKQNTLCPKKNIPDIFDCNLKTYYQILIIFGTHVPDTICHQMTI